MLGRLWSGWPEAEGSRARGLRGGLGLGPISKHTSGAGGVLLHTWPRFARPAAEATMQVRLLARPPNGVQRRVVSAQGPVRVGTV